MSKYEDLHPISPLGQRFNDMNDFFTMIRKDAHKVLARQGSVEKAFRFLIEAQGSLPSGSSISMHSSLEYDPLVIEFLSHAPTEAQYWKSLYMLVKDAGFKDKGEILNETSKYIDSMTIGNRSVPLQLREEIGLVAHGALEEIYGTDAM